MSPADLAALSAEALLRNYTQAVEDDVRARPLFLGHTAEVAALAAELLRRLKELEEQKLDRAARLW